MGAFPTGIPTGSHGKDVPKALEEERGRVIIIKYTQSLCHKIGLCSKGKNYQDLLPAGGRAFLSIKPPKIFVSRFRGGNLVRRV